MQSNEKTVNIEIEQLLLGGILFDNKTLWTVIDLVKAEDFANPIHSEIFSRIVEMVLAGKDASPAILKTAFWDRPDLIDAGGENYITDLAANVISLSSMPDYAVMIAELSTRRKTIAAMREGIAKLEGLEYADRAEKIISDTISNVSSQTGSATVRTKREQALAAIQSIQKPKDAYSTGLSILDDRMGGGLYAGYTYGIAGAEKRGKTTLAHTISHNLNQSGVMHAYIALEMGSIQIEQRNLARMVGINSLRFLQKNAQYDKKMIESLIEASKDLPDFTLYLDMPGASLDELQVELAKLVTKYKIKGFILDYWQLVEGQRKGETEERHLRNVAQWIANFARKNGIWSILLAQVNEEGRLFAGRGLVKACDQLYVIETPEIEGANMKELWLRMTHSRYTMLADAGTEHKPAFFVNKKTGPFIEQNDEE